MLKHSIYYTKKLSVVRYSKLSERAVPIWKPANKRPYACQYHCTTLVGFTTLRGTWCG